MRFGRVKQK